MTVLDKAVVYLKMSARTLMAKPSFSTFNAIVQYLPAWWRFTAPHHSSIKDSLPWMSFSAINFLRSKTHSEMIVFEYGSGGSTLFWSSRVKKVISIEHDRQWFESIEEELSTRNIHNVEYNLIEAEADPAFSTKDPHNPDDYISTDSSFVGKKFETYVKAIDIYPDAYFDIIVVDGRARASCIKHAIRKLKSRGYLVIDNTERNYYLSSFDFDTKNWDKFESYGPVPFSYDFSQTTILQKKG